MYALLNVLLPVLVASSPLGDSDLKVIFKDGTIRVIERRVDGQQVEHYLMQFDVHRGGNFLKPTAAGVRDRSRDAMNYHHRLGPVGQVMGKYNWFPLKEEGDPDPAANYAADARLPASLLGLAVPSAGHYTLPVTPLVGAWSEPPYAVVGMYVGAMAAYARPFQTVDFYESNRKIVKLSLPEKGKKAYFHYLLDAIARGANVSVVFGDARRNLEHYVPQRFYHAVFVEICTRDLLEDVSVELMTREGIERLFDSISDHGVLCFHTSNRYLDMTKVLADVADDLKLAMRVGHDNGEYGRNPFGRFSSEWVVLARSPECLAHLHDVGAGDFRGLKWQPGVATGKHLWTDARHRFRGLFRSDPLVARLFAAPLQRVGGGLLGKLAQSKKSGITYRHVQDFNQTVYRLSGGLSGLTLRLRDFLEPWAE